MITTTALLNVDNSYKNKAKLNSLLTQYYISVINNGGDRILPNSIIENQKMKKEQSWKSKARSQIVSWFWI
jgi:hypothetical protein